MRHGHGHGRGLGPGGTAAAEQHPLRGLHQPHLGAGEGRACAPPRPLAGASVAVLRRARGRRGRGSSVTRAAVPRGVSGPPPPWLPPACLPACPPEERGPLTAPLAEMACGAAWPGPGRPCAPLRPALEGWQAARPSAHPALGSGRARRSPPSWPPLSPDVSVLAGSVFFLCADLQ